MLALSALCGKNDSPLFDVPFATNLCAWTNARPTILGNLYTNPVSLTDSEKKSEAQGHAGNVDEHYQQSKESIRYQPIADRRSPRLKNRSHHSDGLARKFLPEAN